MEKGRQVRLFDRQARQYENKREGKTQQQWRQNLLNQADGEILELSVGAGANFPFYQPHVKITAVDFSPEMLSKAKRAASHHSLNADFILSDIEELEFKDHSFDTIVSTLSFCSYENPLRVLHKLSRWCKPEGNILLMEHGISSNFVASTVQKVLDPLLYRTIGCHHTRDMLGLISQTELTVQRVESYWLNMIHLIWAKPGKGR